MLPADIRLHSAPLPACIVFVPAVIHIAHALAAFGHPRLYSAYSVFPDRQGSVSASQCVSPANCLLRTSCTYSILLHCNSREPTFSCGECQHYSVVITAAPSRMRRVREEGCCPLMPPRPGTSHPCASFLFIFRRYRFARTWLLSFLVRCPVQPSRHSLHRRERRRKEPSTMFLNVERPERTELWLLHSIMLIICCKGRNDEGKQEWPSCSFLFIQLFELCRTVMP